VLGVAIKVNTARDALVYQFCMIEHLSLQGVQMPQALHAQHCKNTEIHLYLKLNEIVQLDNKFFGKRLLSSALIEVDLILKR